MYVGSSVSVAGSGSTSEKINTQAELELSRETHIFLHFLYIGLH